MNPEAITLRSANTINWLHLVAYCKINNIQWHKGSHTFFDQVTANLNGGVNIWLEDYTSDIINITVESLQEPEAVLTP